MKNLLFLLAFILVSCGGSKSPIGKDVTTTDSTYVDRQVRERDTLVKVPLQKVGIVIHQDKLTTLPIIRREGNVQLEIYRVNDTIYSTAVCDSLELRIKVQDSIISSFREVKTDTVVTLPPEQVKYIPWLVKMLAWIGGISLLVLGIRLAIKFYKPII